jgi:hypothetical protein
MFQLARISRVGCGMDEKPMLGVFEHEFKIQFKFFKLGWLYNVTVLGNYFYDYLKTKPL